MPKHPRATLASGINCALCLRTLFGRRTYGLRGTDGQSVSTGQPQRSPGGTGQRVVGQFSLRRRSHEQGRARRRTNKQQK